MHPSRLCHVGTGTSRRHCSARRQLHAVTGEPVEHVVRRTLSCAWNALRSLVFTATAPHREQVPGPPLSRRPSGPWCRLPPPCGGGWRGRHSAKSCSRPVGVVKAVHDGALGDYVLWFVAGLAALGTVGRPGPGISPLSRHMKGRAAHGAALIA